MTKLKRKGNKLIKKTAALNHFYGFHSIVRGNNDCIEVLKGMVGFTSALMTSLLTCFFIYNLFLILLYIPIESTSDSISFYVLILVGCITFLTVPLLIYFTIPHTPSPIRFNRKTREIYIMQHDLPKENKKRELICFDWDKADFHRELLILPSGGGPPRIEHSTFFYGTDLNNENETEHKVQIATGTGSEENQDIIWEYIRRFMENEEIQVQLEDPEDNTKKVIRPLKDGEQFIDIDDMPEYLPFAEQFKSKLRFNFLFPYTSTIIPRLKGQHPKLTMESSIGNIIQFFYYQIKFLVLLVYPFFAIIAIPAMLISSWAYGTKPINEFPEENNQLCGLSSMKLYIKELIKNEGKPIMSK